MRAAKKRPTMNNQNAPHGDANRRNSDGQPMTHSFGFFEPVAGTTTITNNYFSATSTDGGVIHCHGHGNNHGNGTTDNRFVATNHNNNESLFSGQAFSGAHSNFHQSNSQHCSHNVGLGGNAMSNINRRESNITESSSCTPDKKATAISLAGSHSRASSAISAMPFSSSSATVTTKKLSMKEWILLAQAKKYAASNATATSSTATSNSTAATGKPFQASKEYIHAVLNVGHFLSQQICQLEDQAGQFSSSSSSSICNGGVSSSKEQIMAMALPSSREDWSEHVCIHVNGSASIQSESTTNSTTPNLGSLTSPASQNFYETSSLGLVKNPTSSGGVGVSGVGGGSTTNINGGDNTSHNGEDDHIETSNQNHPPSIGVDPFGDSGKYFHDIVEDDGPLPLPLDKNPEDFLAKFGIDLNCNGIDLSDSSREIEKILNGQGDSSTTNGSINNNTCTGNSNEEHALPIPRVLNNSNLFDDCDGSLGLGFFGFEPGAGLPDKNNNKKISASDKNDDYDEAIVQEHALHMPRILNNSNFFDNCDVSLTFGVGSGLSGENNNTNNNNVIGSSDGNGNIILLEDVNNIFQISKAEIQVNRPFTPSTMTMDQQSPTNTSGPLQRIYSLGVVMYELFSGGMRPASGITRGDEFDFSSALNLEDDIVFPDDMFAPHDTIRQIKRVRDDNTTATNKQKSFHHLEESIGRLKSLSVPTLICNFIANMLDSIHGDLSGNDAYQTMLDVQKDVEWMLVNVDRIVQDTIDTDAINRAAMSAPDKMYGMDPAMAELKETYQRHLSGEKIMALVSGPSGNGKTEMARQLAFHTFRSGGIFVSGKFDQLQQSLPYSAIGSAFSEYFASLGINSRQANDISSKLLQVLGQDTFLLKKLIPNLGKLFGLADDNVNEDDEYNNQNYANAQARLQYLMCQFVQVISSLSSAPITLFLDDLQWADRSSFELISRLLLENRFFFLGCCRGDEMNKEHPLWKMVEAVRNFGIESRIIHLESLSKESVNAMISDILCIQPRLIRPLSEIIYYKTKGNPLFIFELLKAINSEGLLRVSLSQRRWEWDLDKIQSRKLPENIAVAFANSINRLPADVKEALCTAACFGASTKVSLLEFLEQAINLPLIRPLDAAVQEGLLTNAEGKITFAHDKIQESAYAMIKPEERCMLHFKYGLSLSTFALETSDNYVLFQAVDQINRGGPMAVVDKAQSSTVANFNLLAGKRAMDLSDFSTAFSLFDHGISFLRKNHWRDHYELSLELYNETAKSALVIGDLASMKIASEQIYHHALTFQDKLHIIYLNTKALESASRVNEAIEKGLSVVSELGFDVSALEQPVQWTTSDLLVETKKTLGIISHADILNLSKMVDENAINAMKFLSCIQTSLFMARPQHTPDATLKMVQLSLTYGICPHSPVAFVNCSCLLAACGEISEAYSLMKVALGLLDRVESRDSSSRVYAIASQVMAFVEPMQSTNDFMYQGHLLGMKSGDTTFASICLIFNQTCAYWGSKQLPLVKAAMENNILFFERLNQKVWLPQSLPLYRSLLAMMGESEGVCTSWGVIDAKEETGVESATMKHNRSQFKISTFNKMYVAFIFRKFDAAKEQAEKFYDIPPHTFTLFLGDAMFAFYGGLLSFWIARVSKSHRWFEQGVTSLSTLKGWAESSNWNFLNKYQLLEAEKMYYLGEIEKAKCYYDLSISSAAAHKFVQEEALACELAGYFYSEALQRHDLALKYFTRAHDKYDSWGAVGKCQELFEFVQSLCGLVRKDAMGKK